MRERGLSRLLRPDNPENAQTYLKIPDWLSGNPGAEQERLDQAASLKEANRFQIQAVKIS